MFHCQRRMVVASFPGLAGSSIGKTYYFSSPPFFLQRVYVCYLFFPLPSTQTHVRTCIRTHAYMHTHTCTHTHTHTRTRTRTRTRTHMHTHTHTHARTHTHTHTRTHTHTLCFQLWTKAKQHGSLQENMYRLGGESLRVLGSRQLHL